MQKIGVIGKGPWGQTLAKVLTRLNQPVTLYGRDTWMAGLGELDAVLIATPPEATLQIAEAAMAQGVAILATKPIGLDAPSAKKLALLYTGLPFYVDYVHLYSPCYRQMKQEMKQSKKPSKISVQMCGQGPIRSFSSLYDYGPHALAPIFDLFPGELTILKSDSLVSRDGRSLHHILGTIDGVSVNFVVGNGSPWTMRSIKVDIPGEPGFTYKESSGEAPTSTFDIGGTGWLTLPADPLSVLLKEFLEAARARTPSSYSLDLSVKIAAALDSAASLVSTTP